MVNAIIAVPGLLVTCLIATTCGFYTLRYTLSVAIYDFAFWHMALWAALSGMFLGAASGCIVEIGVWLK